MSRFFLLLAAACAVAACDATEPNVVTCGDDCPDVSGAGRGGSAAHDAGNAGRDAGPREDAGPAGAGGAGSTGSGAGGEGGLAGAAAGAGAADASAGESGNDAGPPCGQCPPEQPHCDADAACVACLQDSDCEAGVCQDGACVACREDSDCTDAARSRCVQYECTPCVANRNCAHIDDQPVCDAGQCVQCTGLDYSACGNAQNGDPYICDALARTCSTHTNRSAGLCDACVSDAQCGAGQLCVMQYFDEVGDDPDQGELEVGHFCFWRQDATESGAPSGDCANARPYVDTRPSGESIEGIEATVCGLTVTTCAGHKDYRTKPCSGVAADTTCGDARFESDAYCEMFSASTYRCTTPCLSDDDCRTGSNCNISGSPEYCSLQ